MNDYQFKVVKLEGDFIWYDHNNTDEAFIILDGVLRIDFPDGGVHVSAGEMFVVPKCVKHKPYAEHEVKLLLIEPPGVLNTGDEGGERTARMMFGSKVTTGLLGVSRRDPTLVGARQLHLSKLTVQRLQQIVW